MIADVNQSHGFYFPERMKLTINNEERKESHRKRSILARLSLKNGEEIWSPEDSQTAKGSVQRLLINLHKASVGAGTIMYK
jgi:hypothetical protein